MIFLFFFKKKLLWFWKHIVYYLTQQIWHIFIFLDENPEEDVKQPETQVPVN